MSNSKNEISHVVDNGQKVTPQDPLMKKLEFLKGKILEIEDKLEKIEDNTRGPGGSQPRQKFTTRELHTEKAGQKVLSDLGKELKSSIMSEGELDKNDFKRVMRRHGWTAGTDKTYRNWMEKVADHYDYFEYKVGDQGGSNRPSRIVYNEEADPHA